MDLVITRENAEVLYWDRERYLGVGEFIANPRYGALPAQGDGRPTERVAEVALDLMCPRPRKVTAVHKASVLKVSKDLFLRAVCKIDAAAALSVRDAGRFDVIVTTNMFDDIPSNEAAEFSGSASALNCGSSHGMARAALDCAPDIAREGPANPVSLIRSVAMLLVWLARRRPDQRFSAASRLIERSIDELIEQPACRTQDFGDPLGTPAFTMMLCRHIAEGAREPAQV